MKFFLHLLASALFATAGSMQMASAAELRPLKLPSTQQGYIQQPRTVEPVGTTLYRDFEEKVKTMSTEEKEAYRKYYSSELDKAVNNKDYNRTDHFNRLLGILSRY